MSRYGPDGAIRVLASWSSTGAAFPIGSRWSLGGRNLHTMVFQTGQVARLDEYTDASGQARPGVAVVVSVPGICRTIDYLPTLLAGLGEDAAELYRRGLWGAGIGVLAMTAMTAMTARRLSRIVARSGSQRVPSGMRIRPRDRACVPVDPAAVPLIRPGICGEGCPRPGMERRGLPGPSPVPTPATPTTSTA